MRTSAPRWRCGLLHAADNMTQQPKRQGRRIRRFLASVKLTIGLLLILAATSIVGTLIPQNESPAAYVETFGQGLYRAMRLLGLFDMYHSWWFQVLLGLLTLNLVLCSWNRLPAVWKIVTAAEPEREASHMGAAPLDTFSRPLPPEDLEPAYRRLLSKRFRLCRSERTGDGFTLYAEKGRWTRLGVYVVHLSVVFILVGGLIGSLFGFKGFTNIPEGESVTSARSRDGDRILDLGFTIRCDDFSVQFYDSGMPKEYRSTLTVLENEKELFTKYVIVNAPLRYKGINVYQSSYGTIPPREVVLQFQVPGSPMAYTVPAPLHQRLSMPEARGSFEVTGYRSSLSFRGHQLGPAFLLRLYPSGEKEAPEDVILPTRFKGFDKMRKGYFVVSVLDYEERFYTGLQITRDPGTTVVYIGFVMIILGCFVTFFMGHQRLRVKISAAGRGSMVEVIGATNRNRQGFQQRAARISRLLAESL